MNIIGIESSCDETSVAVISNGILKSNLISSQDFHVNYGGVVPELSSRAHIQRITPLLKDALNKAGISLNDVDAVAATAGPGLIGALLVGFTFAKGLAYSLNKPFIPVNHIEGHIFSGFLMQDKPEFPLLVLVVSGGHTLLILVKDYLDMVKLGTTVDDAAGEAFDKVAKMLGLGYPGGPKIQSAAKIGNADKIKFPVADTKGKYDFSFSGLKTSVLRYIQKNYKDVSSIPTVDLNDIAASFQKAVVKALEKNVSQALRDYEIKSISLVGGVAANNAIRESFQRIAFHFKKKLVIPSLEYCGDNAAMIAMRGLTLFNAGEKFTLDYEPFPSFSSKYLL